MKKNLVSLIGAMSIVVSVYATPSMAISLGFGATGGGLFLDAAGSEKLAEVATTTAKQGQENINGISEKSTIRRLNELNELNELNDGTK